MCIEILAPIEKQPIGGELKFALSEFNVLQGQLVFRRELRGRPEFLQSVKEFAALVGFNACFVEEVRHIRFDCLKSRALRLHRPEKFQQSASIPGL